MSNLASVKMHKTQVIFCKSRTWLNLVFLLSRFRIVFASTGRKVWLVVGFGSESPSEL